MANQNTSMVCKGQEPLCEIPINGTYILGIYKGTLSEFDILLKYRQKEDGNGVESVHLSIFIGL